MDIVSEVNCIPTSTLVANRNHWMPFCWWNTCKHGRMQAAVVVWTASGKRGLDTTYMFLILSLVWTYSPAVSWPACVSLHWGVSLRAPSAGLEDFRCAKLLASCLCVVFLLFCCLHRVQFHLFFKCFFGSLFPFFAAVFFFFSSC